MTLKSLQITAFLCFSELNGDLEGIKLVYTLTNILEGVSVKPLENVFLVICAVFHLHKKRVVYMTVSIRYRRYKIAFNRKFLKYILVKIHFSHMHGRLRANLLIIASLF